MKLKVILSLDPVAIGLLSEILTTLNTIKRKVTAMSAELDALTVQVAANTSLEQSAVEMIRGIAAQLADLKDDPAAIQGLSDSLRASAANLAAAIAENTPAAPTP